MNLVRKAFQHIDYLLKQKAIVLSYHRVAAPTIDPWEISVSPENFEEQLQVLKKYNVVTPARLLECLEKRQLKNGMICITFDDGYKDNFFTARPLLEKYNYHSTIFIPVQLIGQQREFWWDELLQILFCNRDLPTHLSLMISNKVLEFNLGNDAKFDAVQHQKNYSWIWYEEPPTKRAELYLKLWEQLRPLKHYEIIEVLENLRRWVFVQIPPDQNSFPMDLEQLGSIIAHPLFDVGIHTVTHPALAYHSKQEQHSEILQCKTRLEELTGTFVNTIAYPYGIYNEDTIEATKECGVQVGFTTHGNAVQSDDHPLKLSRCHVKNWNGIEFEKKLRLWIKGF